MTTTINISGATIVEGNPVSPLTPSTFKQLTFTISLSEPRTDATTLKYVTVDGTAKSGQDYTSVPSGSITFNPGETVKTISIPILNDNINELDETFLVNIFALKNTTLNPTQVDVLVAQGIGKITDTFSASSTATLANTVENLFLIDTTNINGTGNTSDNILTGNSGNNGLYGLAGNDTLNGGAGADTLDGGVGDDTYIVDSTDTVVENLNSGTDTVLAGFNYTLAANVENLTLTGTTATTGTGNAQNNILLGNSANNILDGGDGHDTLNGGAGTDTLKGGLGDDTYIIDSTADQIIENAGAGIDTVQAGFTYSLANNLNLENLTLIGTSNINGTGNSGNNILIGNSNSNILTGGAGNDSLDGGGGADTLSGEAGDDVYVLDNAGDVVIEAATGGNDTIQTGFGYTLLDNFEKLVLIGNDDIDGVGNALANAITGNTGDNVIDGGIGGDVMAGGLGNDTYIVDNVGDSVTENANAGTDTVKASINYSLGANLENLTLTETAISGTGNSLNNILIGNDADNILSGGIGNDTLDGGVGKDVFDGGTGNDIYIVDNAGDSVAETSTVATEIDVVQASVSFTLSTNVENLILTGTANINGTGNALNNTLIGNIGNNILKDDTGNDSLLGGVGNDTIDGGIGNDTLDGGAGIDSLKGGAENDLYIVDNFRDVVTEALNEGIDTVNSSVSYLLGSNLDNLTLLGSDNTNGTGNSLNNIIVGNSGANTLDGKVGNDSLDGAGGNDILIGGLGNDTLNGSTGEIDTLFGGLGDDTHLVGLPIDVIVEAANEGTDNVISSATTYTLSANLENLTLAGVANIDGTGNELANQITGNNGANSIDGGMGNDTMTGGTGNDTYVVDSSGDLVIETSLLKTELDTVLSSLNYTLTANVENLVLTGAANLIGNGNVLGNVLLGNSGNNTLSGSFGDDYLDGDLGSDSLVGGYDNDSYVIDNVGDHIFEAAAQGTDLALSSIAYTLEANVENLNLTGTDNINGTGNVLNNLINGNSGDNTLQGAAGDDTLLGGDGNDMLVGQVANDILTGGAGTDQFNYNTGKAFSAADLGSDRITDFKNNNEADKIILGKTTFGLASVAGNGFSVASEFASVATDEVAVTSAAKIVYSLETGNIFYNFNGVTLGNESVLTTLTTKPTLGATDFIIA